MSLDTYSHYEIGLAKLLEGLNDTNAQLNEALVLQQRLEENIKQARLFGDNENRRSERAQILLELNRFTKSQIGCSFSQLCSSYKISGWRPRINHSLPPALDYQGRPELDSIRKFWNESDRSGVLGLIGIGGSGKTALVFRFLEILPDSGVHAQKSKDFHLSKPELVFVWSFYDQPSSEDFLTELRLYLGQNLEERHDRRATIFQVQDALASLDGQTTLLILDGLEKIQEDRGGGAVFGQLQDQPLRQLLRRLAFGINGVKTIVTSRFPLADLFSWRGRGYSEIHIDKLPVESARSLLRSRGVKGSDQLLDLLILEFGAHALTLDHLGGILREFYGGKASKVKELPPVEHIGGTTEADLQAYRLRRLFQFYELRLPSLELALLQRLAVFRTPVDLALVADVYLGHDKEEFAGALAKLSFQELRELVNRLGSLKLVWIENANKVEQITAHPAVRDHFYSTLAGISVVHEGVHTQLFSLTAAPGLDLPTETSTLDLLEEIIYHAVKAGRFDQAFDLYWRRLGGFRHLGLTLGAYARGENTTKVFVDAHPPEDFAGMTVIQNDLGLYEQSLGKLETAANNYYQVLNLLETDSGSRNLSIIHQNLAEVLTMKGQLSKAQVKHKLQ